MVTFRPMTEGDVPAAAAAFEKGLLGISAGIGLPITGNTIQDERRRQDRTRHFLGTDPEGSWVAEEGETIVGMSQSFVRENYWMLSQLGTVPGRQGRGGRGRVRCGRAGRVGSEARPGHGRQGVHNSQTATKGSIRRDRSQRKSKTVE